jgi:hypothetical protein
MQQDFCWIGSMFVVVVAGHRCGADIPALGEDPAGFHKADSVRIVTVHYI